MAAESLSWLPPHSSPSTATALQALPKGAGSGGLVHPAMTPFSGDLAGRVLAARQRHSAKCLVLDLDNTLWGGVIGDDGLEGIVRRLESALGETYVAFRTYAKALSRRGVMAVCSKNDVANALAAFDQHSEMVLKRGDIACFVANWSDMSHHLRAIPETLSTGIDALLARTLLTAKALPLTWPRSASCAEISRSEARLPSLRFRRGQKVDTSGHNAQGARQGCALAWPPPSISRPKLSSAVPQGTRPIRHEARSEPNLNILKTTTVLPCARSLEVASLAMRTTGPARNDLLGNRAFATAWWRVAHHPHMNFRSCGNQTDRSNGHQS